MKLYFARHGDTDANANSPISLATGEIDEPLNAKGIAQANGLAEELKNVHFDAIISSPLKRAYQTAEIVNKYHHLPIKVDPSWREREIGEYTDPETWMKLFDFDQEFSLEHSEGLKDFFARIHGAMDELKQKYADKTVLVVSHGGVQHVLYAHDDELPLKGNVRISPMKNCEYHIYEL